MKKITKLIKIAESGVQKIELPLITFKNGSGPKILIVAGIHGTEFSGMFVLRNLLKKLKSIKGELNIIPVANPLAVSLKQRENPTDNKDLNRVFPGDPNGTLSQRIAHEIFQFAKNMDLVIDLHTFEDPSPVVGIFMNTGTNETKTKTVEMLKTFSPDAVWKLQFTQSEAELSGALGPKLALLGIVNFAVEMPEHFRITEEQLDKVVNGLIAVLIKMKMVTGEKVSGTLPELKIMKRSNHISDCSGLFISKRKLFDVVKKGDVVGSIVSPKTFQETKVAAQCDGELLILKDRDVVSAGDTLFSIGIKDTN